MKTDSSPVETTHARAGGDDGVVLLTDLAGRLLDTAHAHASQRAAETISSGPSMRATVIALVAGAAGVLALAIEKTATMVGVFISVTTVPAAGNLALGLAFANSDEILGSLAQLGINVACMLVSGVAVMALMRTAWPRITAASERLPGWRQRGQGR